MTLFVKFQRDEAGAITTDWVVLTSAIVGISLALLVQISGGVGEASNGIVGSLEGTEISFGGGVVEEESGPAFGSSVVAYFDVTKVLYPDTPKKEALAWVKADAPSGYNYDRNNKGLIDDSSGLIMYESNDGSTYNIGGEIISMEEYNSSDRTTSEFREAWKAVK